MTRTINQPVGALLIAGARKPGEKADRDRVRPYCIDWDGKRYKVEKCGFYHSYRKGTRKIHVFSVSTATLDMRVEVDSETFECFLTEISDGLAD